MTNCEGLDFKQTQLRTNLAPYSLAFIANKYHAALHVMRQPVVDAIRRGATAPRRLGVAKRIVAVCYRKVVLKIF